MCIYTGSTENHKLHFTQNLSLITLLHLLVYFYFYVFNKYICGQKYICFWLKLRLFSHSHAGLNIFLKINNSSCLNLYVTYFIHVFNDALMLFLLPVFLYTNIYLLPLCPVSMRCVFHFYSSLTLRIWSEEVKWSRSVVSDSLQPHGL